MFDEIGKKLMGLAKVVAIVGIIGSVVVGFVLLCADEDLAAAGGMTIVFGSLFSWIGSWTTYAFGQLVDDMVAVRNVMAPKPVVVSEDKPEDAAKDKTEDASEVKTEDAPQEENK